LIFRLPLVLASVLLVNTVDTIWWAGRGGMVTEHRDRDTVTCMLTLKDGQNQANIAWSNRTPVRAVFESQRLRLPPDQIGEVGVRIGNTWLQGGDGKPNIPALTAPSSIMFVVSEPITDILASAHTVDIRGFGHSFSIRLAPNPMKALVNALARCTAVISRLP
jgi:hypothetical protein